MLRVVILLSVIGVGLGGYLATTEAITGDRTSTAERNALGYSVRIQAVLAQAGSVVAGLGDELSAERVPSETIFKTLADATAGGVGLNDAAWAQHVPFEDRARYQRAIGFPIVSPTTTGVVPIGRERSYLPATYTTENEAVLTRGVNLGRYPAVVASINDQTLIFSVSASSLGAFGDESGFYILEAVTFGGHQGYLVVFVPEGWILFEFGRRPPPACHQPGR